MKHIGRKLIFFIIILIPFWSFLVWFFWPKQEVKALILDKTVLTNNGDEHRSLNWVLTHQRYTKPNGSQYDISNDYFGFFPVNRPEYQIKDLSPFSNLGLDSMANYYNFTYYTDTYGIYQNEWYSGRDINERSAKIYGGLTKQDYIFMRMMYEKRKLVLTEFNIIASPTPLSIRDRTQNLLGIDFSGWTGRYYHSLDTLENPDIPRWMRRLHENYYDRKFDYDDVPGIVLINENENRYGKIVVFQNDLDLEHEVPIIFTKPEYQAKYGVPDYIRYPFWFDITFAEDTNNVYATYSINVTGKGDSALKYHNLPSTFPAVIGDVEESLKYYFCGDFSDNPIPFGLSYFKGVEYLRKIFYNNRDPLDRQKFFWEYYRPMITTIIDDYKKNVMPDTTRQNRIRPLVSNPNYIPFYRRYNYNRPDLGADVDKLYSPNTIYGADGRESVVFNEDSEYEDNGSERSSEDNSFDGFLENVERATSISSDERAEQPEERPEPNIAEQEHAESVRARKDSVQNYERKQQELADKQAKRIALEKENEVKELKESQMEEEKTLPIPKYKVGGRRVLPASYYKTILSTDTDNNKVESHENLEEKIDNQYVSEEKEEPKKEVVKTEKPQQNKPKISSSNGEVNWKVVVASFEAISDAEEFIASRALNASIIYVASAGSNRVVVSQSNTLLEAQQSLRDTQSKFSKAWISKF